MAELNDLQKRTLDFFATSAIREHFYWTGGTLLSVVYLHHRQSVDLDFFSEKPVSHDDVRDFIEGLKKHLGLKEINYRKIYDRLEFKIQNGSIVRVGFVFYDHPRLDNKKKWGNIFIDSLEDIAVNKTMAMFDRNDPKDIFDLYFLLTQKKFKVDQLVSGVWKKFGLRINEDAFWSESLKSLKNLDNLKPLLIAENKKEKNKLIDEAKDFYISHSVSYLHRVLK